MLHDMRKNSAAVASLTLVLGLGAVTPLEARAASPARAHRYRLTDVGTLGGTFTTVYDFDMVNFTPRTLNARGQLAVTSLTAGGFAGAAEWSRGRLSTLASLPNANVGGGGSNANGLNDAGTVIGAADDGVINPLNHNPYDHAVLWDERGVHRLPELDGQASWANFITDSGVIVGYANDAVPDPYTYAGTRTRAVAWFGGALRELGDLGGNESAAFLASDGREGDGALRIVGTSSTGTTPVPPFGIPETRAFVWRRGAMSDLGTLGGGFTTPSDIDGAGRIAVISFDATNQHFQSFVWEEGRRTVLATLGGSFAEATALDDGGFTVGTASEAGDATAIAVAWDRTGRAVRIGALPGDTGSIALDVAGDVVVGGSGAVGFTAAASYAHAFVWFGAGPPEDLNTLVPAGSPLTLDVAYVVDAEGRIAGLGTDAAGDTHVFLLEPDDDGERALGETTARTSVSRGHAAVVGAGPVGVAGAARTGGRPRF